MAVSSGRRAGSSRAALLFFHTLCPAYITVPGRSCAAGARLGEAGASPGPLKPRANGVMSATRVAQGTTDSSGRSRFTFGSSRAAAPGPA